MSDIFVSKYSSLSFSTFKPKAFEGSKIYVNKFIYTDVISIQFIGLSVNSYSLEIRDFNGVLFSSNNFVKTTIDTNNSYFSLSKTINASNFYIANIIKDGVIVSTSQWFTVQEDAEDTVLFEYTNSKNEYDTIFIDNDIPKKFQFRMDGGFASDGDKYLSEVEFRRNQRQEIQKQYDMPYTKHTLVLGDNMGVPSWVAEKINLIMALDNVTIDGVLYVRSEDSIPEQNKIAEFYPYFNYTFILETAENVFYEKKK